MTDHKESKNRNRSSKINNYARFSGIAFQMIAIIALGSYGGVKLDEAYPNKYSLWSIGCSFASVIIAMVYIIRRIDNPKDKTSNE
ncbi:MAG: AtpZ/AtpI family protein [Bacteroidota bacterium]